MRRLGFIFTVAILLALLMNFSISVAKAQTNQTGNNPSQTGATQQSSSNDNGYLSGPYYSLPKNIPDATKKETNGDKEKTVSPIDSNNPSNYTVGSPVKTEGTSFLNILNPGWIMKSGDNKDQINQYLNENVATQLKFVTDSNGFKCPVDLPADCDCAIWLKMNELANKKLTDGIERERKAQNHFRLDFDPCGDLDLDFHNIQILFNPAAFLSYLASLANNAAAQACNALRDQTRQQLQQAYSEATGLPPNLDWIQGDVIKSIDMAFKGNGANANNQFSPGSLFFSAAQSSISIFPTSADDKLVSFKVADTPPIDLCVRYPRIFYLGKQVFPPTAADASNSRQPGFKCF